MLSLYAMAHITPNLIVAQGPNGALLLKPKAAADALQVSERTLFDLERTGRLRALRIGRAVRYDVRDLVSYIDSLKKA